MYEIRVCGETPFRFYDSQLEQCCLGPYLEWEEFPLLVTPGNHCAWQDSQTGKFHSARAPLSALARKAREKESELVAAI